MMRPGVLRISNRHTAIGSANLDNRSFRLNSEVIGIVPDTAFNGEVSRMLEADSAHSKPTEAEALTEQPFWYRPGLRLSPMLALIQ